MEVPNRVRFQIDYIGTVKILIGTNNWDVIVKSYRNKLEKKSLTSRISFSVGYGSFFKINIEKIEIP